MTLRVFNNRRNLQPSIPMSGDDVVVSSWMFTNSTNEVNRVGTTAWDLAVGGTDPAVTAGGPSGPSYRTITSASGHFQNAGAPTAFMPSSGVFIGAWVRLPSTWAAEGTIFSVYGGTVAGIGMELRITSDRKMKFLYRDSGGTLRTKIGAFPLPGGWVPIIVVAEDGSLGRVDFFIGGGLSETFAYEGVGFYSTGTFSIGVGISVVTATNKCNGLDIAGLSVHWPESYAGPDEPTRVLRKMLLMENPCPCHVRVDVKDGAGSWVNMRSFYNTDWIRSVRVEDATEDRVTNMTVDLWRSIGELSIGKFVDNPANRSPRPNTTSLGTYSATTELLDMARDVRVYTCRLPYNVLPVSTDWQMIFEGEIHNVTDDAEGNRVSLGCRDNGGKLVACWVRGLATQVPPRDDCVYPRADLGTGGCGADAAPLETAIQQILDDANTAWGLATAVTLYVPVSPAFCLLPQAQRREPVMEAISNMAEAIGWLIRYKWDPYTETFRLTLYEPARDAYTTAVAGPPDMTVSNDHFIVMGTKKQSLENIRNTIQVIYASVETTLPTFTPNVGTWEARPTQDDFGIGSILVKSSDANVGNTSIAQYGELWSEIVEGASYGIHNVTAAQYLGVRVCKDLSTPEMECVITFPGMPEMLEHNSLLTTQADNFNFTADQRWATFAHQLVFEGGNCRSDIQVVTKPTAGRKRWLAKEAGNGNSNALRGASQGLVQVSAFFRRAVNAVMAERTLLLTDTVGNVNRNHDFRSRNRGIDLPPDGWVVSI